MSNVSEEYPTINQFDAIPNPPPPPLAPRILPFLPSDSSSSSEYPEKEKDEDIELQIDEMIKSVATIKQTALRLKTEYDSVYDSYMKHNRLTQANALTQSSNIITQVNSEKQKAESLLVKLESFNLGVTPQHSLIWVWNSTTDDLKINIIQEILNNLIRKQENLLKRVERDRVERDRVERDRVERKKT